jgi:hypothetical protein
MEMAVGRADFAKLPAFFNPTNGAPPKTEVQLLVQYLRKNHQYRTKLTSLQDRAVGGGYFSVFFNSPLAGRDFRDDEIYASVLRHSSRWFGVSPGKLFESDFFKETTSFLLGLQSGPGGPAHITAGVNANGYIYHTTPDLTDPAKEPKGGFYMLHGSWFADFNLSTNNIMRALVATPNYGLAVVGNSFAFDNPWYYEPLGLGEPIGAGLLRTINAAGPSAHRWMGLMGDPTLRLQITSPASNLSGNNGANITLTWTASPESDLQYYVYRSVNNLDGPWTKLGITSSTTFTDNPAPAGPKMYQVRGARLITTGSGSFTNLSQGIFVNVN